MTTATGPMTAVGELERLRDNARRTAAEYNAAGDGSRAAWYTSRALAFDTAIFTVRMVPR